MSATSSSDWERECPGIVKLCALTLTIDFTAGDALFGGRATQVRYQKSVNDRWKISAAVEDLQLLGIQNADNLPGRATTQWPLLAFRADYRYGSGIVSLRSSIGQLHWDGGANGPSDSAVQLAFLAGGRQNLGERAYATWHLSYSEGAGENIMAFAGTGANAVLDANGNLDTMHAYSAAFGLGYNWTSELSSAVSLAYGWLDTPDSRAPLALKRGGAGHVNLIWKPGHSEHFSTGMEIMFGNTRAQNDATGDATRFQMMAKFTFQLRIRTTHRRRRTPYEALNTEQNCRARLSGALVSRFGPGAPVER